MCSTIVFGNVGVFAKHMEYMAAVDCRRALGMLRKKPPGFQKIGDRKRSICGGIMIFRRKHEYGQNENKYMFKKKKTKQIRKTRIIFKTAI